MFKEFHSEVLSDMTVERLTCLEIAELLLGQPGAEIDPVDTYGYTPLCRAVIERNVKMMKLLIRNGANVNYETENGHTPLFLSSLTSNDAGASILEETGAALSVVDVKTLACQGFESNLEFFKNRGADFGVTDGNGNTALHLAAREGNTHAATVIIDHGLVPIDVRNDLGLAPLHVAARYGCLRTARLLVNKGADVNALSNNGETPMNFATRWRNEHVARFIAGFRR